MNNTYHITGTLEKEFADLPDHWLIDKEIEAPTPQAAADHFEADGWEWAAPPSVKLITEAAKMERAGQPSLFPLP